MTPLHPLGCTGASCCCPVVYCLHNLYIHVHRDSRAECSIRTHIEETRIGVCWRGAKDMKPVKDLVIKGIHVGRMAAGLG